MQPQKLQYNKLFSIQHNILNTNKSSSFLISAVWELKINGSNQELMVRLVSTTLLVSDGRCHNYTIWLLWLLTKIKTRAETKTKTKIEIKYKY